MGAYLRTFGLFLLLTAIFVVFGYAIGSVWLADPVGGIVTFLLLAAAINAIAYFASGRIVLWSYRAKLVTEAEAPKLYQIVREVTQQANLPMPKVAVIPTQTPNAMATGRNPQHAVRRGDSGHPEPPL
jgi:heat shock protein HtpX